MKKVLMLLLICFMALGASLAVADTRTDALGLQAGQHVDDLDSIWLFAQDAANFGNVVDLRMGNPNGSLNGDWGGVIHKDFDEIGYIGIYFNRPFNQADGVAPNVNPANQNGILNGFTTWEQMINPANSSYWGSNYLYDPDGFIGSHYQFFPYGENAKLNYYPNWYFGWGMNRIAIQDPENKADIFWAKDFSDVVLGLHVNYAAQTGGDSQYGNGNGSGTGNQVQGTPTLNGQQVSTYNEDSSVIGLDLGLTLKNIGTNMSLDLGLGYSLGSVNYSDIYSQNYITAGTQTVWENNTIKDNNISELRVNALLKNKMSDTTMGRAYVNARLDNLGLTNSFQGDDSNDGTFGDEQGEIFKGTSAYTDTNLNLGLACDHSVLEGKAKVIVGLGVIWDSRKWTQTALNNLAGSTTPDQVLGGSGSSYTEEWWAVPFNVAIETPLFDWLTARIGASKNLYNRINGKVIQLTTPNAGGTAFVDTTTVANAWDLATNVDLTYGLAVHSGNFTLDFQVNPNALMNNLQNFAPGQGIAYGTSNNNAQTGSAFGQIYQMFTQADVRYAF